MNFTICQIHWQHIQDFSSVCSQKTGSLHEKMKPALDAKQTPTAVENCTTSEMGQSV